MKAKNLDLGDLKCQVCQYYRKLKVLLVCSLSVSVLLLLETWRQGATEKLAEGYIELLALLLAFSFFLVRIDTPNERPRVVKFASKVKFATCGYLTLLQSATSGLQSVKPASYNVRT
jgi:hypothetical protein